MPARVRSATSRRWPGPCHRDGAVVRCTVIILAIVSQRRRTHDPSCGCAGTSVQQTVSGVLDRRGFVAADMDLVGLDVLEGGDAAADGDFLALLSLDREAGDFLADLE